MNARAQLVGFELPRIEIEEQDKSVAMSREFAALAYDNRVSDSGAWPAGLAAPPLIGTSAFHNVSLRVGRFAAQKPFSLHDRMTWLLETLPHAREAHVAFLDAGDVACLCDEAEIAAKARRLLAGRGSTEALVVSAEAWIWPRSVTYRGERAAKAYPPSSTPLRFINVGGLLGRPLALAGVLNCMRRRYGFPATCPEAVNADGSYTLRPVATTLAESAGLNEQACWHVYLLEQSRGVLPPASECPRLVPDYAGELFLPLSKVAAEVKWGVDGRVTFEATHSRPCWVHANGAAKYLVEVMQFWLGWVGRHTRHAAAAAAELRRAQHADCASPACRYLHQHVMPQLAAALPTSVLAGASGRGGFCDFTYGGEGDGCTTSDLKGSWSVTSRDACVARCARCDRCHWVSHDGDDCSWFRFCDGRGDGGPLLRIAESRHVTLQVRRDDGSLLGDPPAAAPPPAPPPPPPFFMHTDPRLDHSWLRHCEGFDELRRGVSAERLGEVRMHALLRRSARRVADPASASLFYLPLWEYTSYAVGHCNGTTHVERMAAAAAALRESAPFARRGGADHFWVSTASLLHAEETAPWLDTRLGDAGPKGYAGLMARVGAALAPLLALTTVARTSRTARCARASAPKSSRCPSQRIGTRRHTRPTTVACGGRPSSSSRALSTCAARAGPSVALSPSSSARRAMRTSRVSSSTRRCAPTRH